MIKLRFIDPLVLLIVLSLPCSGCVRDTSCAFVPQSALSGSVIPEGFGVNIDFTDPRPGEITMLSEAGFRWVRMDLKWDATEREPGRYDFSAYDRLMTALEPQGIHALFILDYGNPLYDDGAPPRNEATRNAFARWAVAAAKHFAGRSILWEVYNEPNHSTFWPPKPNPQEYVALALAVGRAFRASVPDEKLIGPATSEIDFNFLESCFKAGLLEYWSAVSIHPYRRTDPETAAQDYCRLREMIKEYAPVRSGSHSDRAKTQKSHLREWVDGSSPAYNGALDEFLNPTHGSGWMVQNPPWVLEGQRKKAGLEQSTHSRAWNSQRRSVLVSGRLDLNDPPTPVGGISEFSDGLRSDRVASEVQSPTSNVQRQLPDIPIISSEWGYSSVWPGRNEEKQGELLARAWLTNVANGVSLSIWYDWRDDGLNPNDPEHHFGTVSNFYHEKRDRVYDRKPAYLAAAALTTFLSGYRFESRVNAGGAEDYVLAFRKGSEFRFAAWTTAHTARNVLIPLSAGRYTCIRYTGQAETDIIADQKGMAITVSTAPIYFGSKVGPTISPGSAQPAGFVRK